MYKQGGLNKPPYSVGVRLGHTSLIPIVLSISQPLVGVEMGAALKQITSWLMKIPHFGGTWLHYTRYVSKSCIG